MKKITLLILILATTKGIAQIYFSPNTNMYVKNEILYVTQDINLAAATSNLYLRNNSQLIQGTTGASTNTGLGTLSVYQEGTADNFDYNYWCSPVGVPGASGNGNFGITMLGRPTTSIASTTAAVLPVSNWDGTSNPLAISPTWVYKLINANNYSQWVFVGGATTLLPGEGFSMKGTSGTDAIDPEGSGITNNPGGAQRYDFRGKPNDGVITIPLGANNATLTGNPYPSAIHLNAFLLDSDNTATGGIAYFWQQDKTINSHTLINYRGGYGSYAPINLTNNGTYVPATFNSYNGDGSLNTTGLTSASPVLRRYAPIGQGFVISATANGTARFKNSHRVFVKKEVGSSQFERSASKETSSQKETEAEEIEEEVPQFRLNTIIDNQFTRQVALVMVPQATDGIDIGMDALNMDDALPNDITFLIENNSYVIQGVNFDVSKKIPLVAKVTTNCTFKFYIPEVINFDNSQIIYLYDALDNSYHDIKNGSYEISVTPGYYTERFKLTFRDENTLGTGDVTATQFFVIQDNVNSILKASNPNNLALQSFKLYDVVGKVVLSKKDLGTEQNYTFSTTGLSSGIYFAEFLTTNNERFREKIIISNSAR